nr:ribonuclease H-like domain-containing protein [Tanacetum cinerariifolium]
MKIDLDDKADVLAYHKKLFTEALKEKEELKNKFENWQNSSKNLSRLFNIQMSANDKFGLGYGDYRYGSILSYENEVLRSVFMNKASDLEDTYVNDRYADGMHAVPPPMTGNSMPSRPDVEIDYSKFTYGPKQTLVDESNSKTSEYASCESDSSLETTTSMPKPVENAPKVVCEPKVWTDAPIIENHLIRDCDFHEKRMVKQAALTKIKNKVTCQRENRPVWNNVQRVNHQNKFIPSVLLTKTGKFLVNAARQNYSSQAPSTSTASKDTAVKALAGCYWRNKRTSWNKVFNYNIGSKFRKSVKDPLGRLKSEMAWGTKLTLLIIKNLRMALLRLEVAMEGKLNKVLFTDTDCLVLSLYFKLPDENQVLLKIPRQHNKYSFNFKNIDPSGDLASLFAKASIDESKKGIEG